MCYVDTTVRQPIILRTLAVEPLCSVYKHQLKILKLYLGEAHGKFER
jgi:hypothetical protein